MKIFLVLVFIILVINIGSFKYTLKFDKISVFPYYFVYCKFVSLKSALEIKNENFENATYLFIFFYK